MDSPIKDIKGWSGSEWGMDRDKLLYLFDGEINILDEREDKGGDTYWELFIDELKIHNFTFKVIFYMSKEKDELIDVLLEPVDVDMTGFASQLNRLLSKKYGTGRFDYILNISYTYYWVFPSTLITLRNVTTYPENVTLRYEDFKYKKEKQGDYLKWSGLV